MRLLEWNKQGSAVAISAPPREALALPLAAFLFLPHPSVFVLHDSGSGSGSCTHTHAHDQRDRRRIDRICATHAAKEEQKHIVN